MVKMHRQYMSFSLCPPPLHALVVVVSRGYYPHALGIFLKLRCVPGAPQQDPHWDVPMCLVWGGGSHTCGTWHGCVSLFCGVLSLSNTQPHIDTHTHTRTHLVAMCSERCAVPGVGTAAPPRSHSEPAQSWIWHETKCLQGRCSWTLCYSHTAPNLCARLNHSDLQVQAWSYHMLLQPGHSESKADFLTLPCRGGTF